MRIAILSTSEATGGAAVVTRRITEALRSFGHDARMVVLREDRNENNDFVETVSGNSRGRLLPFIAERGEIFLQNSLNRRDLWKVSTASTGVAVKSHPFVAEADAVIIGWICQGFMSLAEIGQICATGKPTLMVMHDQWAMTGICHLPGKCRRWAEGRRCGKCPLLHGMAWRHDLSRRVWNRKAELYRRFPHLKFVAVSSWLAARAAESTLLGRRKVAVIPNPIALPLPDSIATERKPMIVTGAARLDDDVKNLPLAIEALNLLYDSGKSHGAETVFFGGLRDTKALDGLRMPHRWTGPLKNEEVKRLMGEAKVVLSTSHFEMLPTTIVEGLAQGCVAVATDSGGQRDIIDDGVNGRLAAPGDAEGLADALAWALGDTAPSALDLRLSVEKFDAEKIARRYLELLESLDSQTV